MGQVGRDERGRRQVNEQRVANWIQFGLLLLALFLAWSSLDSRLSKVEQRQDDAAADRVDFTQRLERIERMMISRTP